MENLNELSKLFVDDYKKPIELTEGQKGIFNTIIHKKPKRVIALCPSQYGKSLTVSLAVLLRAIIYPEKWAIVAPSEKKARIIMGYITSHLDDDAVFRSQVELKDGMTIERLKRERSKQRITFKRGGEVFILSADGKNKKNAGSSLLGFGAANIVLDESVLLDDDIYMMVKRMLLGSKDNFLFEIGNPIKRNHFFKTWSMKGYSKIFINDEQAVLEGRLQQEDLDEIKAEDEQFYNIMYRCKFPEADEVDIKGYMPLITRMVLEPKLDKDIMSKGRKRLGCDISRGGSNYNCFVIRTDNSAYIIDKNNCPNLIETADIIYDIAKKENIPSEDVFVDDSAVGGGVVDSLRKGNGELRKPFPIIAVNSNHKSNDLKYYNIRATLYWRLRQWLLSDITIKNTEDIDQLMNIRYIIDSSGRIKIMPKLEMKKLGIESPDFADALAFTFYRPDSYNPVESDIEIEIDDMTGYPTGRVIIKQDLSKLIGLPGLQYAKRETT